MHKEKIHTIILFSLLGILGHLWFKQTGNIKPGGLEPHLALMVFGGAIAIYSFNKNKKQWFSTKNNICALNTVLAAIFILFHIAALTYVSIMLVVN